MALDEFFDGYDELWEIVEPAPGRVTHHLGRYSPGEVDAEVRRWLEE